MCRFLVFFSVYHNLDEIHRSEKRSRRRRHVRKDKVLRRHRWLEKEKNGFLLIVQRKILSIGIQSVGISSKQI